MRIAIIADPIDNQNAGIHVYTREMVDALIRTNPGHELILIREKKDPDLKGVTQIAIPNIRLPIGFASLRLFFIIPLILRIKKVDVVIEPAHFGPFNLPKKIKRITIIHDLTPILFPQLHRWHSQMLQKLFLKKILNKADLIITNSDNTSKDVCTVYPANCKKVVRIYPGISAGFHPTINSDVLKKYNIKPPYLLFVGTIEPRKNLVGLLNAFELFKQTKDNAISLVIAGGKGWKSETFFSALAHHPYRNEINCTGFIDRKDLPALYTMATAFVYPSVYEGFGLPVAEALKCNTPVITSDNSALRETGGNLASYFNAEKTEDLALLMNEVTTDSIVKSKAEAMNEHVSKFTWNSFSETFWKAVSKI